MGCRIGAATDPALGIRWKPSFPVAKSLHHGSSCWTIHPARFWPRGRVASIRRRVTILERCHGSETPSWGERIGVGVPPTARVSRSPDKFEPGCCPRVQSWVRCNDRSSLDITSTICTCQWPTHRRTDHHAGHFARTRQRIVRDPSDAARQATDPAGDLPGRVSHSGRRPQCWPRSSSRSVGKPGQSVAGADAALGE